MASTDGQRLDEGSLYELHRCHCPLGQAYQDTALSNYSYHAFLSTDVMNTTEEIARYPVSNPPEAILRDVVILDDLKVAAERPSSGITFCQAVLNPLRFTTDDRQCQKDNRFWKTQAALLSQSANGSIHGSAIEQEWHEAHQIVRDQEESQDSQREYRKQVTRLTNAESVITNRAGYTLHDNMEPLTRVGFKWARNPDSISRHQRDVLLLVALTAPPLIRKMARYPLSAQNIQLAADSIREQSARPGQIRAAAGSGTQEAAEIREQQFKDEAIFAGIPHILRPTSLEMVRSYADRVEAAQELSTDPQPPELPPPEQLRLAARDEETIQKVKMSFAVMDALERQREIVRDLDERQAAANT